MDSPYNWIVFLHVTGAFTFVLAHGASAAASLRLRDEREVPRAQALLEVSRIATMGMYAGLLILLLAGITAAFMAGLWGRAWMWTAIVILVLMIFYMFARASRFYAFVRRAAGLPYNDPDKRRAMPAAPADPAVLDTLLRSSRPIELAGVGSLGLAAIIWLMVMKPF